MALDAHSADSDLVAAVKALRPDTLPHSDGLRSSWADLGGAWISRWAESLERDVQLADEALRRGEEHGATDDGAADVEHALWRVNTAYEKLHAVIALALGVPALSLKANKLGIRRFEPDRKQNRKKLRELTAESEASELLKLDEQIHNHRFCALRHALTHSLAPILAWESLMWFELGEVDERGGVIGYSAHHLSPSETVQGTSTPPDGMFARAIADGSDAVLILRRAIETLAGLLASTATLEPPPVLWRVMETGEIYLERDEASRAAREASGYVSPFDQGGWQVGDDEPSTTE